MRNDLRVVLISVAVAVGVLATVALVGLLVWWGSPMREFGFRMTGHGPMSTGMMRQMHAIGDVQSEYEYMSRMIPHHEEAVETATILRDRTDRQHLRGFAQEVIEVQTREIEQMEQWISQSYPDRPPRAEYDPMMRDLDRLSGDALDRAFLEDMIPHHMAAVMMSQQLLARNLARHDEVADLASSIRESQMREIRQMSIWLRDI